MATAAPIALAAPAGATLYAGKFQTGLYGGASLGDVLASGALGDNAADLAGSILLDGVLPAGTLKDAMPGWLSPSAINEWVVVPGGKPSTASGLLPAVPGSMGTTGQRSITDAWGGAFYHGTRFFVHGGGHGDYGGNEVGAIDLADESPTWDLLVERTPVGSIIGGSNYYADGMPTSRHTYYGMKVVESAGVPRMLRFNAWMGFAYNGGGGAADVRTTAVDAFRLDTNAWEPAAFGPVTTITGSSSAVAQDVATGDCFVWHGSNGTIQHYVAATNGCSQVADLAGTEGNGAAMVFDHLNGRLVRFGGSGHGCTYWDVESGTKNTPTLIGPGAATFAGSWAGVSALGIAHDPARNVVYLCKDGALLKVRLSDFYVEPVTSTGVAPVAAANGTWGRFCYIAQMDCVVYLASWLDDLLVMRCGS